MNWLGTWSVVRLTGGAGGLVTNVRLAWRLLRDGRVPLRNKIIIPAAAVYMLWPLDLLVDLLPFLGQVDDIGALILAVALFVRTSPQGIVAEHRDALAGLGPDRQRPRQRERGDTIEATYRVIDDEVGR